MTRLIICCDGTWNNPEQEDNGILAPTNVYKLHNAVAENDNGVLQLKYYHPGVGGEKTGIKDKVLGGAIGFGMSQHIQSAYHWLATHYNVGDEIYLFGFSRGAFVARSLAGFLSRGLLNLHNVAPDEAWMRVEKAYKRGYRVLGANINDWANPNWSFFNDQQTIPIRFLGVWDTVGALGVPDDLEILNLFDKEKNWQFHDTSLGAHVQIARHAMAMDEIRSSFTVTRWQNGAQRKGAKELWFPGSHSDVGGGYANCDLSNGALLWMIEESNAAGLAFRDEVVNMLLSANAAGMMHNSYRGAFAKLRSRPRNIPALIPRNNGFFHQSAFERQKISPLEYPSYHPTITLKPGESVTVDIFADTRWNPTHVYLSAGEEYTFSATGEWLDSDDSCDWKGTQNDELTLGDIIRIGASALGILEDIFKKGTGNQTTDFLFTKRIESMKWFVMVGAIANDSGQNNAVANDGSPTSHQYIELPAYEAAPFRVNASGYLYCFPNDVWSLYGNNHGSVQLTIHRTA